VVRGSRSFRITGVEGEGDGITADVPRSNANLHVLVVHCKPNRTGEVRKQLLIRTDLDGETVPVTVEAVVLPRESNEPLVQESTGPEVP
jgi:hypothetical protein